MKKTSSAVSHKLEIMGEAAKNVPDDVRQRYNEVPWSDMARTRDRIIHAYFGLNYQIIWRVIKERLPELKPKMREILEELKE